MSAAGHGTALVGVLVAKLNLLIVATGLDLTMGKLICMSPDDRLAGLFLRGAKIRAER